MRTFTPAQNRQHSETPAGPLVAAPEARHQAQPSHTTGKKAAMTPPRAGGSDGESSTRAARFAHDFTRTPAHTTERPQRPAAVERYPFRAAIRRATLAPVGGQTRAASCLSDGARGKRQGVEGRGVLSGRLGASPPEVAPPRTGAEASSATADEEDPTALPDITIPELANISVPDGLKAEFIYSGSVAPGPVAIPPGDFGATAPFSSFLKGAHVVSKPGVFEVTGTFEHPITYQVRSEGPEGQRDIASVNDNDITETNYSDVASDLTPDMSDLNGRPPRKSFWAKDLTERHELFHTKEYASKGPGAMAEATQWLNGQTAETKEQVVPLLKKFLLLFESALRAALPHETAEQHAYGDGAPVYSERAATIKAKGDRGDYEE